MQDEPGRTLQAWLDQARPSWRRAFELFVEAAKGLAAAHDEGRVHGDFRPANVRLDDDGRVRLTGFGGSATASGFRAPEQPATEDDPRSDQFAFCVALFWAVYGRHPYTAPGDDTDDPAQLDDAIRTGTLHPPSASTPVPPRVWQVLRRGLSRDPSQRWPSMTALIEALHRTTARRSASWAIAALLGGATVAGIASFMALGSSSARVGCRASDAPVAETWDAARRDAVAARIGADADDVIARLERWAQGWDDAHRAACEMDFERNAEASRVFDGRMACLERGRLRFDALLDVLAESEVTAERATAAVAGLPRGSRCLGDDAESSAPPPESQDAVAKLEAGLARAEALLSVGRLGNAQAVVARVIEQAEVVGWADLSARAREAGDRIALRSGGERAAP